MEDEVAPLTSARDLSERAYKAGAITLTDAVGMGEPRDPARHRLRIIVKAVTYHQLKVEQAADGWSAEVYLDI